MSNELSDRQMAIRLRLSGESPARICNTLTRSRRWFQNWWQRYLELGAEGLYDLSRANHQVTNRTPPYIERAVVSVRRRLAARATPQTRYTQVGAAQIRGELEALGYTPLPCLRTIERIVCRAGLSCPPLRLAPRVSRTEYPGPQAQDANQVHQVDGVGPRYLKGDSTRYYFLVCKDAFDQSVYIEFVDNRKMDTVLVFLVAAWQRLGLPEKVQFDNGREFCGFGNSAQYLSRVIRLCLRLGVEPVFIPEGNPQHNGSVENFNGWFQPLLLHKPFSRPGDVRRELRRLVQTVNEVHIQPRLGHQTAAQYRRGKQLRKLPADFSVEGEKLPIAAGKVTFIRLVSAKGHIRILEQPFKVGKRLKFQYVKATLSTRRKSLKVYHKGRLVKEFAYELTVT